MSLRRVVLRVAELAEFAESCVSCLRVALELLPAIICRLQHFIPHSRLFTPACTASTTSALSCFTPAPSLAAVIRSRKPFIKTFFCSREIYDTDHDSSNSAKFDWQWKASGSACCSVPTRASICNIASISSENALGELDVYVAVYEHDACVLMCFYRRRYSCEARCSR